jgi:hypothetical protein
MRSEVPHMHTATRSLIALAALVLSIAPASANWTPPKNHALGYEVTISRRFTHGSPWTGALAITINSQDLISGQYKSTSVKPDPFRGNIVHVNGALSGTNIRLDFNVKGTYQLRGTISQDKIVGTFYDPQRNTYDFLGKYVPATH